MNPQFEHQPISHLNNSAAIMAVDLKA